MIKYCIAFICLFPHSIYCQDKQNDTIRNYNSSKSIEYIDKYITIRFSQSSDIQTLAVKTDNNKIELSPNAKSTSRISFNYKFISFSFGYIPKFLPGNDDKYTKGESSGTGYGLTFNFRHWQQEISYSKTKGYYLENTSDYHPTWTSGDPYVQFPELVYKNFQGVTAYNFNKNFSVSAITSQSERQVKSAGSFIPHLIYRYYIVDDKKPIDSGGSKQKSNNFEFVLGAGYYHSFVIKQNFYFSFGLTPGGGYVFTKLTTILPTGTLVTNQQNGILRLDGRLGLGYNSQRFFSGIYMRASGEVYSQEKTSVINQEERLAYQIFFGYRLKAPGWLRDKVKYVSDKIGI